MRTFQLNNKLIKAKEFDFNLLCDLEEQGLSLEDIDKKPMSLIRTYVSFCTNMTQEQAGKEIEAHVENGNDFSAIIEVMSEEMNESGFFRSLNQRTEPEEAETSTKSPKSKKA